MLPATPPPLRLPSRRSASSDMLRLLGSVQRQRQEHRKMQRLILDTSGRGQQGYHGHLDEDEGALPPVTVRGRDRLGYTAGQRSYLRWLGSFV